MRILLVEDDEVLGSQLGHALTRSGLAVTWTQTLEAAREALDAEVFSGMLLDLGLPDGDGVDFLRGLRRQGNRIPVMIISARARRDERILGLDGGADDYITKPYDLDELEARLRALLRRSQGIASQHLYFGDCELDLKGQVVLQEGREIALTLREFRVLSLLAERAGRWVPKTDLEHHVYDDAAEIESNTMEAVVYMLRRKLGGQTILTARGLDYMVGK